MVMLLKFGDYNSNYKYLFFVFIFNFLSYYIFDGNLSQLVFSSQQENFVDNAPDNLYIHPYFIDSINYLGIIIISIILYKIREKQSSINNQNNENKLANAFEIRLIHNDIKQNLNQNISFLKLVFILSYWVFIDHITKIIQSLMIFDYWMFELLFICLISSKLLKTEIFRHQILGIIINSVSCLFLGIIKFIMIDNHYNNEGINIYNANDKNTQFFCIGENKWYILISIIIYLFIVNSTSYIFTELKFYMDLKFISQTKLLILYGLIGFILNSIACAIETSFKCVGKNKDFFCKIKIYLSIDSEDHDSYIENILLFFEDFSGLPKIVIIIEIFLFLFGIIFYYGSLYFEILVIKFLTPMHFMFSSLIYLLFIEFYYLILIKNSEDNKKEISYQNSISTLNIIAYIISLIGFMIYLEIIELNFCKLNYNLRKHINARSLKDSEIIMNDDRLSRNSSIIINDSLELDFKEESE